MKIKHLGQICVGPTLTEKEIKLVSNALNKTKGLEQKIKLYALLSGKTRYKLIKILSDLEELCVCDMAEILKMSVSAISHQLKILRKEQVVTTRREGQIIYYSVKSKEIKRLL